MATLNPFKSNKGITLVRNGVITLTKRTVRFSKNVYQTHNITSFSEGEVDVGTIPWWIIVVAFLFSSLNAMNNNYLGWYYFFPGMAGVIWNFYKPKHYGLLISLNSGDKTLFTTNKTDSLKEIIGQVYDFIETEKEATYQISISNSKVSGNFIQGNAGGDTSYLSDD
ncbi:hypothetical protein [Microcoleus sp. EPA2]|uniref:hypothetical protein n=1 Tax=Microcoleus sp. EPA2 TaxID=2841654 RepID=UPI00312BAB78